VVREDQASPRRSTSGPDQEEPVAEPVVAAVVVVGAGVAVGVAAVGADATAPSVVFPARAA